MRYRQRPKAISIAIEPRRNSFSLVLIGVVLIGLAAVTMVRSGHAHMMNAILVEEHNAVPASNAMLGYANVTLKQQYISANNAYDEGDIYLAFRMWSGLAAQGNADAAFKVGMMYDRGEVVEHDASQAAYWYQQAANAGHPYAQHNLGVAYANGDGVEIDISKAMGWWLQAAEHGNVDSQYNLGIIYAMGSYGIHRDTAKALKYWRRAAQKGDAMAQFNLGTLYANGDKAVRNVCEAMRWLAQSAASGISQASHALEVIKSKHDSQICH